jgi:two-component system, sensor histidine kinase and response regulator
MTNPSVDAARIMVVDDTPENLTLLHDMLRNRGYQVFALPSGEMALKAAARNRPDLILLDIGMPGLNGYEVCKKLKDDPHLAEIPVIFLSALNETEDKIKAFHAGGVDYITKPFQSEEVEARVRTHLKLRELQRELQEHNLRLESLVAQRTGELKHAYAQIMRLDQTKSDFLAMISHEMRTPLNGIFSIGELAFDMAPESAERNQLWDIYLHSRHRMESLLDDAGTLNTLDSILEHGQRAHLPILQTFHEAEQAVVAVKVLADFPSGFAAVHVLGESVLLKRALETLIELAACFTVDRDSVIVAATATRHQVQLDFALDHMCITDEQAAGFFDIASSARSSSFAEPLGLAPVVAHRVIALFGGEVRLAKEGAANGALRVVLVEAS